MSLELENALKTNFRTFARKAFRTVKVGEKLEMLPYVELLIYYAEQFAKGNERHVTVQLPPRHCKTFIFSIALMAWILAHQPTKKILIVTGNDILAKDIAHGIRAILTAKWFKTLFRTRIAANRSGIHDFATAQGGRCFITTLHSNFTGVGADIIDMDDVHDIVNGANDDALEEDVRICDTRVLTRLNDRRVGQTLVVGQRVGTNDIAAYMGRLGIAREIKLELIAEKSKKIRYGDKVWHRKRGEQLRPNLYSAGEIAEKRAQRKRPDFQTLYQQDPDGDLFEALKPECFQTFRPEERPFAGVVLSVDPGQELGPTASFSVIQAWCSDGRRHFLLDQWRDRADVDDVYKMLTHFRKKYRPSFVLIERTALGIALISKAKRKNWSGLREVRPGARSKAERLRPHVRKIRSGQILLPVDAPWGGEFVGEFVNFRKGSFSDQVDAATQYLDFAVGGMIIPPPPPPRSDPVAALNSRPGPLLNRTTPNPSDRGISAVALGSRFRRF